VFGLTGGGIMHLVDAVSRSEAVSLQAVHHEEFAGVAADGYSRAGKPYGVAMATTGPGVAHLFAALAAAWQDSSPVIFLTGQVKMADSSDINNLMVRQNGTFEFDAGPSFSPICKKFMTLTTPKQALAAIEEAVILCRSGRPGPVVLELPLDVQGFQVTLDDVPEADLFNLTGPEHAASDKSVEYGSSIRERLEASEKPVFLIGAGVVRAALHQSLTTTLNELGLPYLVTQFAREAGVLAHPYYMGSPGIKANRSANLALSESDLVIAIGTSLHQQVVGWDKQAFRDLPSWKIWSEIDLETLEARSDLVDEKFSLSVEDSMSVISEVIEGLSVGKTETWSPWRARCENLRELYLLHFPTHDAVEGRVCLYRVVSTLSDHSSKFTAAVTDAGTAWYALPQHFFPNPGSKFISSGSFGSMGMALPFAIGAAHSTGGKVLALTGDGSLMTCLSELATLRQSLLPIVLIINSNNGYQSINSTQDRYFNGRRIGTDSTNGVWIPDLRKVAETFEIPFRLVQNYSQLENVLAEVTNATWSGPVIVEVRTFEDQVVEPYVASFMDEHGVMSSGNLSSMLPAMPRYSHG